MADLDTLESSSQLSRPVELYEFAIGSEEYFYTSSEDDIVVGTTTYEPEPGLQRKSTKSGRDERNRVLEIRLPASNPFASKWKVRPPGLAGSVTIFRIQRDETPSIGTTQVLEFKGTVRAIDFPEEGLIATMGVASIELARNRPVPRYEFTALCNHFLYGPGCGVDQNLHKVSATVIDEDGLDIEVPGCSAFPDGTFVNGYVKPQAVSDFRLILVHVGDVLTLQLPFKEPVLSTKVDAYKGCDREIDGDCQNTFNNVIEFGGFPFTPTTNPTVSGLL